MTTQLVKYEQARAALAECRRVDEVKDIRDKAQALAAYARQARDKAMLKWVTEIRARAERRAGEMLASTEKQNGGHAMKARSDSATEVPPRLSDLGISRDHSSQWQQLAAMPEEHFEAAVATAKETEGQVTTSFLLREAKQMHQPDIVSMAKAKTKPRYRGKPKKGPKAEAMRAELEEAMRNHVSMLSTYGRLLLSVIRIQDEFSADERNLLIDIDEVIQRRVIKGAAL